MEWPFLCFGIWTVFAAIAIVALLLAALCLQVAAYNRSWRKETEMIAHLENCGGSVIYLHNSSRNPFLDPTALFTRNCRVERVGAIRFGGSCDDSTLHAFGATDKLRVEFVEVSDCEITDSGLGGLSCFRHLGHLRLNGKQLTDSSIASLSAVQSLVGLDLWSPQFSDEALAATAVCLASRVEGLSLGKSSRFSDAGLIALRRLSSLKYIDVTYTQISDNALVHLKHMAGLKAIWLFGTRVSKNGAEELAAALPDCEVNWERGS